jgi:hypothetical protein
LISYQKSVKNNEIKKNMSEVKKILEDYKSFPYKHYFTTALFEYHFFTRFTRLGLILITAIQYSQYFQVIILHFAKYSLSGKWFVLHE